MFANIFSQSVIYVVLFHIKFLKNVCSICQSFPLWLLGFVLCVERPSSPQGYKILPLYLFRYFEILIFYISVLNLVGIKFSRTVWDRSLGLHIFMNHRSSQCTTDLKDNLDHVNTMGRRFWQGPPLVEIAPSGPASINHYRRCCQCSMCTISFKPYPKASEV